MRLHCKNAPECLVADDLLGCNTEVPASPEIPCVPTAFLFRCKPRVAGLVATRIPAGAVRIALLCASRRFHEQAENYAGGEEEQKAPQRSHEKPPRCEPGGALEMPSRRCRGQANLSAQQVTSNLARANFSRQSPRLASNCNG